tara:strand:- start:1209 stop:2351 length:1143 start_codon:yes stop_codon:yes gene_type:complete
MKKIFYWSPCLANVGTIRSTINSAIALSKYNNLKYEILLINSCGEWDKYRDICKQNNVKLLDLTFNYFNFLPKRGYILSRISYLIVFFISYLPLLKILNKNKESFIICHLITSLPLLLMLLHKPKINFILRISGYPNLNLIREQFWKFCSKSLYKVTSPTIDLIDQIKQKNIFNNKLLYFLPDAVINMKNILKQKKNNIEKKSIKENRFISVGRLTKQKNFLYLIDEFEKFAKVNSKYNLFIYGEGEQLSILKKTIHKKKLKKRVFLMGFSNNIFFEMRRSSCFLLTSLWEEPGIVLMEAAINNLFIISSDCKNGPREFLNNGKAGVLFKKNQKDALFNELLKYEKIDYHEKKKKIFNAKLNSRKYSTFYHYLRFKEILK